MIRVRYNIRRLSLRITGHAGAMTNEQGHDLVCCAASTLAQAYVYAARRSGYDVLMRMSKGRLTAAPEEHHQADGVLRTIYDAYLMGLRMLAEEYPAHICLVEEPP